MSRPSIAPAARALSLTEELEKLEQSITLTLQEIDSNFSRAHRIVTASIIPIVQQYAQHSDQVWQSSRFWKDFFEASANISLTGYEESATDPDSTLRPADDDDADELDPTLTGTTDSSSALEPPHTRLLDDDDPAGDDLDDSLILDSPRPAATTPTAASVAAGTPGPSSSSPSTPAPKTTTTTATATTRPADPLLHRVLDKNYRVQATPRTAQRRAPARALPSMLDSSPLSAGMPAPALRAEIFGTQHARGTAPGTPRTPGVSVQRPRASTPRTAQAQTPHSRAWSDSDEITDELDEDDDTTAFFGRRGMSPPKTVALNLPPSRVVATPAREASRRMVEDLVRTAGGGGDDTDEITDEALYARPGSPGLGVEDSPSVVRVSGPEGGVDDSF